MAVVSVEQTMPFGAGGDWTSKVDSTTESLAEAYIVKLDGTDTPAASILVARDATGVPSVGDNYSSAAPQLVVKSKEATPTLDFKTFLVQVNYSSATTITPNNPDPVDDPWVIDFPDEIEKRIVEKTVLDTTSLSDSAGTENGTTVGASIQNAAGEPFDNPPEENWYPGVIVMSKNVNTASISLSELLTYRGTINDDAITVAGYAIPKWHGRIVGMSASFQDNRGKEYYRLTYRVRVLDTEWVRIYLNRGWKYRPGGAGTQKYLCKLKGGAPVTSPVDLNETGTDHSGKNTSVTANWIIFGTIKETDWTALTTTMPTTL